MTAAYPSSIQLFIDNDGDDFAETDISSRVVTAFTGEMGTFSYKDVDRISRSGNLKFQINNADDAYTAPLTLSGKAIRLVVTYSIWVKQVWFGYIRAAKPDGGTWGTQRVSVSAQCWMDIAGGTRVKNLPVVLNVRANEAIPTLVNTTPNPPAWTDLDIGFETFPTMYDGAGPKTVVYSELDKVAKSELGHVYLKVRNKTNGETLRFESYLNRSSIKPVSEVPTTPADAHWANASDSGDLRWGNSTDGGKIKIPAFQDAIFDRTMMEPDWVAGENVINEASTSYPPRNNDASVVVLYELTEPIFLGTLQEIEITGEYADPQGGRTVAAFDVVQPVATTDYLAFANADGTGTNLTANLISKSWSYGANGWRWVVKNNNAPMYITQLNVRGKGIYKYNSIELLSSNVESQEEIVRDVFSQSLTREYSNTNTTSKTFANMMIAVDRTPRNVLRSVTFNANTSEFLMLAFMALEQGDKVTITDSRPSHTGNYFIQGVKFTIALGGVITFTWFLKEEIKTICQPITIRADAGTQTQIAVDYGILPYLANMAEYSYSFWIKSYDDADNYGAIISRSVDDGTGRRGNELYMVNNEFTFYSYKTPTDGVWETSSIFGGASPAWFHIVVTYDNGSDTSNPRIFVNSIEQAFVETTTPSGTTDDDSDCPLILFNVSPNPATGNNYYLDGVHNFALKDVRVYNKILTDAEIDELYAGEDDYTTVQDGLLWNGIYAPTDNIDDYIDGASPVNTIEHDDLVLDCVYGSVGVPYTENEDTGATPGLNGLDLT